MINKLKDITVIKSLWKNYMYGNWGTAGEEPHWVYAIRMVHASAIATVNNVSPALEFFEKVQSNI